MGLKHIPTPASERADIEALLKGGIRENDWQENGACWNTGNTIFLEPEEAATLEAIEICNGCTVRINCLQSALGMTKRNSVYRNGVWGGYSEEHRRVLRIKIREIKKKLAKKEKVS